MADESGAENDSKSGFFARLKSGLAKTRSNLAGSFDNIVHGKAKVGPELLEELEETLLIADVGMQATSYILEDLKREVSQNRIRENKEVLAQLKQRMVHVLSQHQKPLAFSEHNPFVILVIGVNGSGKTTTIGKLARHWKQEGKKVLLAAGILSGRRLLNSCKPGQRSRTFLASLRRAALILQRLLTMRFRLVWRVGWTLSSLTRLGGCKPTPT